MRALTVLLPFVATAALASPPDHANNSHVADEDVTGLGDALDALDQAEAELEAVEAELADTQAALAAAELELAETTEMVYALQADLDAVTGVQWPFKLEYPTSDKALSDDETAKLGEVVLPAAQTLDAFGLTALSVVRDADGVWQVDALEDDGETFTVRATIDVVYENAGGQ